MQLIKLRRAEWEYDPGRQLGKAGGFGAVFEGTSSEHGALAIKRLHLRASDAAHREMKIAEELAGHKFQNVIPVFDSGEDKQSGSYFVVMARAERSLQDQIRSSGKCDDADAAKILLQIVNGLIELSSIVHRDLKPDNVLFHSGNWKVADFGIARFVEDATSANTLKDCLTPQYAAPEQWNYERATQATDAYALGCIGYALLTGQPPFQATTSEGYRNHHLNSDPPTLTCAPQLRTVLSMMLRKPASARPTLATVKNILENFIEAGSGAGTGVGALAQAGAKVATAEAAAEREQHQQKSEEQKRIDLATTAQKVLSETVEHFLSAIKTAAPNANIRVSADKLFIALGSAQLELTKSAKMRAMEAGAFRRSGWDVVQGEIVGIVQKNPEREFSASLWYCKLPQGDRYRWYEVSYFSPFKESRFSPYHLTNDPHYADEAASKVIGVYNLAFGPAPIDDENINEFVDRWAGLLAKASQGRLSHPRELPLRGKFWE